MDSFKKCFMLGCLVSGMTLSVQAQYAEKYFVLNNR